MCCQLRKYNKWLPWIREPCLPCFSSSEAGCALLKLSVPLMLLFLILVVPFDPISSESVKLCHKKCTKLLWTKFIVEKILFMKYLRVSMPSAPWRLYSSWDDKIPLAGALTTKEASSHVGYPGAREFTAEG